MLYEENRISFMQLVVHITGVCGRCGSIQPAGISASHYEIGILHEPRPAVRTYHFSISELPVVVQEKKDADDDVVDATRARRADSWSMFASLHTTRTEDKSVLHQKKPTVVFSGIPSYKFHGLRTCSGGSDEQTIFALQCTPYCPKRCLL